MNSQIGGADSSLILPPDAMATMSRKDSPRKDSSRQDFLDRCGSIYENARWVAEAVWNEDPEAAARLTPQELGERMAACVDRAADEKKLALLRAHPELAAKARDPLTPASQSEQRSLGLDACEPEEAEAFADLNRRYRQRFGFPFIVAVKTMKSRAHILQTMEKRLGADRRCEFAEAMRQTHLIARLRLGLEA